MERDERTHSSSIRGENSSLTKIVKDCYMAAPKGHPRYGGRTKGTLNKRTASVLEILNKNNFDVIQELIDLYRACKTSGEPAQTALRCLEAVLPYVYPKVGAPDINIDVFMLQRIENLVSRPKQELITIATSELKRLGKADELSASDLDSDPRASE